MKRIINTIPGLNEKELWWIVDDQENYEGPFSLQEAEELKQKEDQQNQRIR